MCILEKLNFKISRGSMPPDPPSLLAPSAVQPILAGPTLNCFRRACVRYPTHDYLIKRLQRVQLAAAGFVCKKFADLHNILKLKWIPIAESKNITLLSRRIRQ